MTNPSQSLSLASALAVTLCLASGASAENAAPTLADLGKDAAMTAAYEQMAGSHPMPEWIRDAIVVSPAQQVSFGGKDYLALQGCKQHDCAANQFAMLYAPDGGSAFGLLSTADGKGSELLTWLGLGGGDETIDGRTILYAALTGSLSNHPQDFSYD